MQQLARSPHDTAPLSQYHLKKGLRSVVTVRGEAGKIALDRWLS